MSVVSVQERDVPRKETDHELREARYRAHQVFDQTWTTKYQRGQAYTWLMRNMSLSPRKAHIKFFDLAQCYEVIRLVKELQPEFTGRDPNERTFERRRKVEIGEPSN